MIVTASMECQSAAAEPTSSPHDTHDIAASTSVPRVYLASRARLRAEVTDFLSRQDATERRARGGICSLDA